MLREPVVDGRFYPGGAGELAKNIAECRAHALGVGTRDLARNGRLAGIICPHAGYMFSGPVASWSFQRLALEDPLPEVILMLGPKHTPYGAAAAISGADGWKTPLGVVPVHQALRRDLAAGGVFDIDDDAHAGEHSLEVQVPFLQTLYQKKEFAILPVALQYASFAVCRKWGEAIGAFLRGQAETRITCLISSDFSHETPREEAYRLDGEALDLIEKGAAEEFYQLVVSESRSICGVIPITVFLVAMQSVPLRITRLKYATSMDVMKHPRGVGYAAVTFEYRDAAV